MPGTGLSTVYMILNQKFEIFLKYLSGHIKQAGEYSLALRGQVSGNVIPTQLILKTWTM